MTTLHPAFLEAELFNGKERWAANLSGLQCVFVPLFYIRDVAGAVWRGWCSSRVRRTEPSTIAWRLGAGRGVKEYTLCLHRGLHGGGGAGRHDACDALRTLSTVLLLKLHFSFFSVGTTS